VSKSLAQNHEIAAFNGNDEIIYTTHPQVYSNKEEFFQSLFGRVTASASFKNFYRLFEAKKSCNALINSSGSGIQNQFKKWIIAGNNLKASNSLIGEPISVITLSDVSKQFTENEKIASNYERLEAFLDHFPFGIFYVNNLGKIVGSNVTFANFVNFSRERLIGMDIKNFIDGFDYNIPPQKQHQAILKPRLSREIDIVLLKFSMNGNVSIQPWIVFKSRVNEDSLEEKNNFIEQEVFNLAPIPSVITTPLGEIKALNPALATMIQDKIILEKNKIIKPGGNILDFIKPEIANGNIIEHLKYTFSSMEISSPVEIKFSREDIIAMAYISRIDSARSTSKLLLIQLVDITNQKILEQRLIQSQKMQAIGQLAGGIAHDFNNLLTAMIGFCDLLLQRYTPNDPSYGDVVQIKQNAGRAANLVKQLLAFSRQQTLKPKVVSVTELLVDLFSLLKRLIGVNIDFQIIHGRDIWPVEVDNSQFEQVIINLVVNARDAMGNNGKLVIRTKNYFSDKEFKCVYDVAHPGDYVLIEVVDTGCGIDKSLVESIFDPFFSKKDEKAKKTSGAGIGLGLSTVYGIVNQTGGFINVETEIGKGANFKIYLPKYTGLRKLQDTAQEQVLRDLSGSETVLLVEDEDPVRMFSARALRDKGYKVLEAASGEEALAIAKNEKFDLLVTDVVMPKIDGPTLNKMLREKIKNLKTIFISGYTEDTFRQDVGKNSSIHFLQKPFTLKDLASKVKEVITNA
jgi:two-component system cell cycle sensor histidine kinase/response regulator CckA